MGARRLHPRVAAVAATLVAAMAGVIGLGRHVQAQQAPAAGPAPVSAPLSWAPQTSGSEAELRGISAIGANVAWASGAKGTVLRTLDGGKTWRRLPVPDADALDFRDIQAFDASTAIIMSAGPGEASRMYRTKDGGATWQQLIANPDKTGFWDAIAFWDAHNGIVFGDAVNGAFTIFTTKDGGDSWQRVTDPQGLAAQKDEGAFAASGTCLTVAGSSDAWFVTGGAAATSRVFHSTDHGRHWHASALPIPAGASTKGGFSIGFRDGRTGFAVGGDYKETTLGTLNGARSEDGGATWQAAAVQPVGYMSAVAAVPGAPQVFVAGGLAGSGISRDAGKSWTVLDTTPINAVSFASPGAGWVVGPKGLVMKYVGPSILGETHASNR